MGEPGDRWSLARVYAAMLIAAAIGAGIGLVVDLTIGRLTNESGWWTVTAFGGAIVGIMAQGVREFARPSDPSVYGVGGSKPEA